MQKQDLASQMAESQQEFRKQFDPNSSSHHGGLTIPVPLGGERIPQSMPTTYPQDYNPLNQSTEPIDYGEQYKKVESDRTIFQNLKKSLTKICPILQACLRHQQAFKLQGDPNNQKHIKTYQQNLAKEKQRLIESQEQLAKYLLPLQEIGGSGKEIGEQLNKVIEDSNKKYDSKQSLTDFNFKVKRISTKTFAEAQKCLQALKEIKKNYKKKQQQPKPKE